METTDHIGGANGPTAHAPGNVETAATRPPDPQSDSAAERYLARLIHAWQTPDNEELMRRQVANFRLDTVFVQPMIHAAVGVPEAAESLGRMLEAIPDLRATPGRWAVHGDTAFIELEMNGTFARKPISWRLVDRFTLEGDLVVDRETYFDSRPLMTSMSRPRGWPTLWRAGMMPALRPKGPESPALRWPSRRTPEPVAEGVWRVRGGRPKIMNVYLVRDGDGVMLFDAGIKSMRESVLSAAAPLGGVTRILLGHAHIEHRGVAAAMGVPVLCHPAERPYAEGDGGAGYMNPSQLNPVRRLAMTAMAARWDGGPVTISETVEEGDEIAGFRVVHLPGHAPGQIGLWRDSDGLALTTDCFFTVNLANGRPVPVEAPPPALSHDIDQARDSMRKLAALEPRAAWPGHADPLLGRVRERLENAASA